MIRVWNRQLTVAKRRKLPFEARLRYTAEQGLPERMLQLEKNEEEPVKKPFDIGDKVHVKKTALLPTGFDGQVGKVYENSILIDIDPDTVAKSRSEELHDLHGRVIVRFAEAKKIEAQSKLKVRKAVISADVAVFACHNLMLFIILTFLALFLIFISLSC